VNKFCIKRFRPTYLSNKPISAITSFFREQTLDNFNVTRSLDTTFTDIPTSILIGHSMGGLVSRTITRDFSPSSQLPGNPKDWGGLISVGTPHLGAQLLTNLGNGLVDKFIVHAEQEMSTAFFLSLMQEEILEYIYAILLAKQLGPTLSVAVNNNILYPIKNAALITNVKNISEDCVRDMAPASSFLANLNTSPSTPAVPSIGIYGNSAWQSHLRIASCFKDSPAQKAVDQAKDDELPKKAHSISKIFRSAAAEKNAQVANILAAGVCDPFALCSRAILEWSAGYFTRAARYIDYGSQVDWANVIGASRVVTKTYQVVTVTGTPENIQNWNTSVTLPHTLVEANDGVVSKKSQVFPGSPFPPIEARGANHLIQGNHRSVREALVGIFSASAQFPIIPK
jgi:hypothetical protein